MIPNVLKIAFNELGQKEISGANYNARILEYQNTTGLQFGNDETPWCSIFANWVALKAGKPRSNSAMAKSWKRVGSRTYNQQIGDIAVLWQGNRNGPYGHVRFFLGYTKSGKSIYCLGGNQNDEVNVSIYPLYKVEEFRDINVGNSSLSSTSSSSSSALEIPSGTLRKGNRHARVKQLQKLLIHYRYLNGSADGDFGSQTERALKDFQRAKGLTADGIYGNQSRSAFEEMQNRTD